MAVAMQELFTPTEAAALTGVSVRVVRKEIEKRVIKATHARRRSGHGVRVELADLYYLRVLGGLDMKLSRTQRVLIHDRIRTHLRESKPESDVVISGAIFARVGEARESVLKQLERLHQWQESLVRDPAILGGAAVFPGSRLSVRHVGTSLNRGEPPAAIKEDYPYLSDEDLEFARLYVNAYPNVGRPKTDQAATR